MPDGKGVLGFLRTVFEEQLVIRSTVVHEVMSEVMIGETPFTAAAILRADEIAYESEYDNWLYESWIPEQETRLAELLDLCSNRERFNDLKEAAKSGYLIPLVGSGMSVPSGLGTWSDFLRSMLKHSTLTSDELDALLSEGAFEEAAEQLKATMPERLFDEQVDHELRIPYGQAVQGPVRFLPALAPRVVLTTNLDDVLELAFEKQAAGFKYVLSGTALCEYRSLMNVDNTFLLKLHGDSRQPGTRVLTTSEYSAAYSDEEGITEELKLICQTNTLLCLGCSLRNDRTVRLIHNVAQEDSHMPRHFAMLHLPDTDEQRIEREHFLAERGLFPIWYDEDHDGCLQSLLVGLLRHCGSL